MAEYAEKPSAYSAISAYSAFYQVFGEVLFTKGNIQIILVR